MNQCATVSFFLPWRDVLKLLDEKRNCLLLHRCKLIQCQEEVCAVRGDGGR